MGLIRRYYYANKKKILKTIFLVIFIIIIIQFFNYMQRNKSNNTTPINNVQNLVEDTSLTSTETTLGNSQKTQAQLKKEVNLIDEFFDLCNEKNFEQAFELVSEDCKRTLFNTYEIFKTTYCDIIFSTPKEYVTESWSGNIYKVRIFEDSLATGNTSENAAIQEYITIDSKSENLKLNINNYIGNEKIDKKQIYQNITITVQSKDIFMDYEIYNIQVKNNTNNTIYLDDGEDVSTIYIEDANGIKYEAASSELIFSTFIIPANTTMNYSIKYTNSYRTTRQIKKMIFKKIILNYDEYIKNTNEYEDTIIFEIDI